MVSSSSVLFSDAALDDLMKILATVASDQESRCSELACMEPQALDTIRRWNTPGYQTESASLIHASILEQCQRQSLAPGICAWDGSITYGNLERLSGTVTQKLVALNVGLESVIPVCFKKSLWTAMAILGVLRAGAAFTLLGPYYPLARLQGICEDVKAQVILASREQSQLDSI